MSRQFGAEKNLQRCYFHVVWPKLAGNEQMRPCNRLRFDKSCYCECLLAEERQMERQNKTKQKGKPVHRVALIQSGKREVL